MAQIRTRKDGGCSLCTASDENVGKRRCCHVLDNMAITVRKEKGMRFVDISGRMKDEDIQLSGKTTEKGIKKTLGELGKGLSKKNAAMLYDTLNKMQ